ncbi:PQQ-dependent sugar dehydrogenase [Tessaracoccus flavus]|uniref:Dehydrogenase n=1 Tax=Tessaracoccus flavus TaxID=1610493 RepID=A0A1Q2CH12_9ACTN|nr:PQQ-dependent sugar dehydrogenase [Tessaracoccus flavus]AQP45394.1 dehydrogenase [Tessaracoccus flavus]SDY93315.1 Glucose/arabinose dehydrogenase, beta-propeller fold [Tessaracoccus flavus]
MRKLAPVALATLALVACSGTPEPATAPPSTVGPTTSAPAASPSATTSATTAQSPSPATSAASAVPETHELEVTVHDTFDEPWAMAWLPGTDALVITERGGTMKLRDASGVREVSGVPEVVVAGQGGLGDVIPGPTFTTDGTVYLSWVEAGDGGTGAVVGTAKLDVSAAALSDVAVIWEQRPKVDGDGHFAHRLAIQDDHLFVSSGDRQKMDPAQELDSTLGKILRLTLDGQPAADNPFSGEDAPVAQQFYSMGHRNPLGLAFDADGRLWSTEMGPKGGDELNLIQPGANYGWPVASNGSHYGGGEIPDHTDGDGFEPPKVFWTPSISPGSLMIYQGTLFPAWTGDAFIGGLSGEVLIRVDLDGETATEAENWPMGSRIRALSEGPDGAIWVLEDGPGARLLELRPS